MGPDDEDALRGIFGVRRARASALAILAAWGGAACAGRPPASGGPAARDTTGSSLGSMPLAAVYQLESTGAPPPDTTVVTPVGIPRTVVLRHAPPDNVLFATVRFDSLAFQGAARDSVTIHVTPRPGAYGLSVTTSAPFTSATITFSYPVHFFAPSGARQRYGSDLAVERALAIASLARDTVTFLPSVRPATDNISAIIPGSGTYLVAVPR